MFQLDFKSLVPGFAMILDTQMSVRTADASPMTFIDSRRPQILFVCFQPGESKLSAFPADEALRKAALDAVSEAAPDIHAFEGRVCTGDQFISETVQKDNITNNFGGLCCEMEGGAIAQTCYLNNSPFVIIRAISDKPGETEIVDYQEFEAKAAENCAKIVLHMVETM